MSDPDLADALTLTVAGLRYTLDRPPERGGGKVVLSVRLDEVEEDVPLRDKADLYTHKARYRLARLVADAFARQVGDVMGHLAVLLDQVERARAQAPEPAQAMTEERRRKALALLACANLLDLAAQAMTALGYVGEEQVKRLAFLVATSRLLPKPLSAILLAPSGSGKSVLLDVVEQLMPQDSVKFLSRITPQALFYAGADALRNMLILVDEQAGSAEADLAVRTLQSKGHLRLMLPLQGKTRNFEAHGPIALMSGTTSNTLNAENLSRCLQLSLDDGPAQTRRIQEAQRATWAGRTSACADAQAWQDAQHLLEPLSVLIPYAERLTFPARTTHDRRGNQKLLGLVAAHALLCQRQRKRTPQSQVVASVEDYRAVHSLLIPVVEHDLDGLSPRAARVARTLASAPGEVTRRDVALRLGWSYNTAKRALAELVDQEVVAVANSGPPTRYRFLDGSILGAAAELLDPEALR